jgi:acyl-CoA reductase-like NAD-dependent aldehyde dehydrogenase
MARGGERGDVRHRGPEHGREAGRRGERRAGRRRRRGGRGAGAFEGSWSKVKPDERAKLINRLADLIEARGEELALTETLDVGRPIQFSRMIDVGGAVGQLRYQAGWATKIQGETNEISAPANG